MAIEIIVPTLGESVSDATVARWIKTTGDNVAADEPVVELETDKVTLEVPAPAAGQIGEIVAAEGAVVEVGAILARLEEGAGAAPSKPAKSEAKTSAEKPAQQPAEKPAVQDAAAMAPAAAASHDHLSPAVRRLVTEHNLDPARISGTGVGGRLTKADILNAVNKAPSATIPAAATPTPLAPAPTP
ncbi:MAG: biotin/lipoyl-containing protein, partial [Candidatus Puniceispirillaceae bacterium]